MEQNLEVTGAVWKMGEYIWEQKAGERVSQPCAANTLRDDRRPEGNVGSRMGSRRLTGDTKAEATNRKAMDHNDEGSLNEDARILCVKTRRVSGEKRGALLSRALSYKWSRSW